MHQVLDLDGDVIARAQANPGDQEISLVLTSAGGFAEGKFYYPPSSLTLNSQSGLEALRDLLDEMLAVQAEKPELPKLPPGAIGQGGGFKL